MWGWRGLWPCHPKFIIADEPTAGLDVSVQGEVLNLLGRLQRELGISILIITHNLSIVRHVADRMAIMYLGRFVEEGTTEAVFDQPRHPYTLALLSASPEPDPDARLSAVELTGEVPSLLHRPPGLCEFHTRCPFAKARCARRPARGQPAHRAALADLPLSHRGAPCRALETNQALSFLTDDVECRTRPQEAGRLAETTPPNGFCWPSSSLRWPSQSSSA